MNTPMDRAYAQKIKASTAVPFESASKRAAFWAGQQRELEAEMAQEMDQNLASISQGTIKQNATPFASANISTATLDSATPALPGQATIAGIEAGGIAPPPPPR